MLRELMNSFVSCRLVLLHSPSSIRRGSERDERVMLAHLTSQALSVLNLWCERWANSKCMCNVWSLLIFDSVNINKLLINNQILHLLYIIYHNYQHDVLYFKVVFMCSYCWVHVYTVLGCLHWLVLSFYPVRYILHFCYILILLKSLSISYYAVTL